MNVEAQETGVLGGGDSVFLAGSSEAVCRQGRVLALDISTKTGWALFVDGVLVDKGVVRLPKKVCEYGTYPWSYYKATVAIAGMIIDIIGKTAPDAIVIEETNGSRARYTQKILEFLHCQLLTTLDIIGEPVKDKLYYVNSSEWRKVIGLQLSKEQKKANAKLSKAARESKDGKVDKAALGIKGKVTKKHLSVAYANQKYNLTLKVKDNDIADAICLGTAFINGANVCDGT